MKRIITIAVSSLALLASSGAAQAEHHGEAPQFQPVEMLTCNYNKGKGSKDLDRLISKFNAWADQNDPAYTAWVLTPNFTSADITFDVAWLGAWPDFAGLGAGTDMWPSSGLNGEWEKVLDCDSHAVATVANIVPAETSTPPESSVIMFQSCAMAEGATGADSFAAYKKMSAFMKGKGSKASAWVFYPGMGTGNSGDGDFDYYFVRGYPDYKAVAHDMEVIANGGGYMEGGKIFKGVSSCDHARAYDARLVRAGS